MNFEGFGLCLVVFRAISINRFFADGVSLEEFMSKSLGLWALVLGLGWVDSDKEKNNIN